MVTANAALLLLSSDAVTSAADVAAMRDIAIAASGGGAGGPLGTPSPLGEAVGETLSKSEGEAAGGTGGVGVGGSARMAAGEAG